MRLRFHVLLIVLIASLALNAGVGATFGVRALTGQRPENEDQRGRREHRLADMLGLPPAEAERVREQEAKLFADIDAIRDQLRPQHEALTTLMTAAEPDRDAIRAKLDEIGALRHQMTSRLVEHLLDVRATLDAPQREKLDEFIMRRFERHGPGSPGDGPPWKERRGGGRRGGPNHGGRSPDAGSVIDHESHDPDCRVTDDERMTP
jgi:Spy/CpxP family protein refolding chaperone